MKKMLILPVVVIALMVVSCGSEQTETNAQKEQAVADSIDAYDSQIEAQAIAETDSVPATVVDSSAATQGAVK